MNLSFHAHFYYTSRQLFECINDTVATAYTLLLTLRIALPALHIKRYVPTFSNSAVLIHSPLRECWEPVSLPGLRTTSAFGIPERDSFSS